MRTRQDGLHPQDPAARALVSCRAAALSRLRMQHYARDTGEAIAFLSGENLLMLSDVGGGSFDFQGG